MTSADQGSYAPLNLRREPRVPADLAAVAAHPVPLRPEREGARRAAARDAAVHAHVILRLVHTTGVRAVEGKAPVTVDAEVEEIGRGGTARTVGALHPVADVHARDVARVARDAELHAEPFGGLARVARVPGGHRGERGRPEREERNYRYGWDVSSHFPPSVHAQEERTGCARASPRLRWPRRWPATT